ncbi:MAG TPA: glycohydrolase toxin TNT-related protein, partial [Kofleriaceae bacterium]
MGHDLVCRPEEPLECSAPDDPVEEMDHAIHGAELVHAASEVPEHDHVPAVPPGTAPGTPMDPDYWIDAQPATETDLAEIRTAVVEEAGEHPPVAVTRTGEPMTYSEYSAQPRPPLQPRTPAQLAQDRYCALGEDALQQESQMLSVPERAPISPDSSQMLDDMRAAGYSVPDAGSPAQVAPPRAELDAIMRGTRATRSAERRPRIGPEMDPEHVPGPAERIRYPRMDGALGNEITPTEARVGDMRTRVGPDTGDFLAVGDPTFSQRAVGPMRMPATPFDEHGHRTPFFEHREYSVARPFPEEQSIAAPALGGEGMATQVRASMSARALESGGYLDLERHTSYHAATPDEIREIDDAAAEEALAEGRVPPERAPIDSYGPPEGVQPYVPPEATAA